MLRTLSAIIFAAALSGTAHAHSYDVGPLKIGHPFARPSMGQQPHGAAYITVENKGGAADALVKASSPVATEVQLHSMKMDNNVMRMREVGKIELPANSNTSMKPGDGYHLMLMNLKQPLKLGDKFPLTLNFEKAGQVEVTVVVEQKAPAQAEPMHGKEHKH